MSIWKRLFACFQFFFTLVVASPLRSKNTLNTFTGRLNTPKTTKKATYALTVSGTDGHVVGPAEISEKLQLWCLQHFRESAFSRLVSAEMKHKWHWIKYVMETFTWISRDILLKQRRFSNFLATFQHFSNKTFYRRSNYSTDYLPVSRKRESRNQHLYDTGKTTKLSRDVCSTPGN